MKKKVIVAGHICIDITPVFPSKKVKKLTDVMTPGKLINMKEADVHTGGSVANTGLAMKILGSDVSLMGKIGDDAFGEMIYGILKKYDAEKGMIISEGEDTSYTVVVAIPGIDRIFLHNPGANHTFCAKDIPRETLDETALFHFGYPPLMKSMFINDGEELLKILKFVKEYGVSTSLDMAAVDPDSESGQADWGKILEKVMPYVDFFMPSVEELCYMLDRDRFFEWKERAGDGDITEILDVEKDIKPLAKRCMNLGAKILIIKCGALGMYYETADKSTLGQIGSRVELDIDAWNEKSGFEKSYVPRMILSGTGAGDTSIAAFLTAMLNGYSIEKCIQFATATGACCVEKYDALSGLKSLEELEERIESGWEKNNF